MGYNPPTGYEFFYQGSQSQLDPNYGPLFMGYRVPFSSLQLHTNPQTPNIAAETSDRLSQGVRGVMVNVLEPRTFEHIPKQLFEEVRQLHKLTGGEPSMHAPIIEPSGFQQEGWTEGQRENAERQIRTYIDKAHIMDPSGNIPVTLHTSMMGGLMDFWKGAPKKEGEGKSAMGVVNTDTNQLTKLHYKEEYLPAEYDKETGKGGVEIKEYTPEKRIESINNTHWHNQLVEIERERIEADHEMLNYYPTAAPVFKELSEAENKKEVPMTLEQQEAVNRVKSTLPIYEDVFMKMQNTFGDVYETYKKALKNEEDDSKREDYEKAITRVREIGGEIVEARKSGNPLKMSTTFRSALQELNGLANVVPPEKYVAIEDYMLPKSAKTFGNVAFGAWKKYGDKAPVMALENVYPSMPFSRAESLKRLIKESRKKFVEQAKKQGYGTTEAKRAAEKIIGATWDVGHIHELKKHGYNEEDIVGETKKIAPFVKFSHLTDNFGYEDSHLPLGMGDVPFKEHLKALEKAGKLKHAIESGGILNMGKEAGRVLLPTSLQALGSQVYPGQAAGPFWNQTPYIQGSYNMGYGRILPEQHFGMYGGGFSQLPQEVGGTMPGRGQRFSGAPME
ncbi:MAG: sugar phosphate isomerase/epimerase [archaeon]|nr:MAG: sugar phosphate isomerase/epimerase [archaeon]